jgi:hypothetical protein
VRDFRADDLDAAIRFWDAATADIVHATGQAQGTLTAVLVSEFEQDITDYARA